MFTGSQRLALAVRDRGADQQEDVSTGAIR